MSKYGEPWTVDELDFRCGVKSSTGHVLWDARYGGNWGDMQRAAACVNACADLNPAGIPFLVQEVEKVVAAMRAALGEYHDPTNILPTLDAALRGVKG